MDIVSVIMSLFNFILHIDTHLIDLTNTYGTAMYVILFLIIFAETGLVVTPFLPGDSLLFAAGALAAIDSLNIYVLFILLSFASVLGDSVNYEIGKFFGIRSFSKNARVLKTEYLDKTAAFYKKYGSKTIVIARFMPIVRTFAPFVAGACRMEYKTFFKYNVFGGILWAFLFLFGGYMFGNLQFVKENFSAVILAIIILSILPAVVEYVRVKLTKKRKIK